MRRLRSTERVGQKTDVPLEEKLKFYESLIKKSPQTFADYIEAFGVVGRKKSVGECPIILVLEKEGFSPFWIFDKDMVGWIYENKVAVLPSKEIHYFLDLFDAGKLSITQLEEYKNGSESDYEGFTAVHQKWGSYLLVGASRCGQE